MSALSSLAAAERDSRQPVSVGAVAGVVLSLLAVLPTMGAVLIVPVVPLLARAFATVPAIDLLAPVILTLPALCIGLLSPLAGAAADRFGRRRLLIGALVVYGLAGTAPALLNSIPLIIATRCLVGASEAVVMTCCTTLVGDYFSGALRERWLSYQAAVVAVSATLLFVVGGALGAFGWRAPFLVYAAAFLLALAAVFTLPEPRAAAAVAAVEAFPWKAFRGFIVLASLAAVAFYAVPVQIGFILGDIGIVSPPTIGLLAALQSVGIACGAVSFHFVSRHGTGRILIGAAALAGCGILTVTHATSLPPMIVGLLVDGFGTGLLLPTLLAMAMLHLPFELRGRGTGIYMSAFFIGQFFSPIIVTGLAKLTGQLASAIGLIGWASLLVAIAGIAVSYRSGSARSRTGA